MLIAFGGFLLPAAALACLELRSRLGFIGEGEDCPDLASLHAVHVPTLRGGTSAAEGWQR